MAVVFKIEKTDLNFTTNAQIRTVIGRVLTALNDVYRAVDNSDNALRKGTREMLDGGRVALEKVFGKVPNDGNKCTTALAIEAKNAIIRVRSEALTAQTFGNIDDAAFNSLSNALKESAAETAVAVKETTKKAAKAVVQVAKETTKAAGEIVGGAASGILGGLGFFNVILIAGIATVVLLVIYKPDAFGRIFSAFRGRA